MEIIRYLDRYKTHSPKKFYDWLSEGRTMEIRFLSNHRGEKFDNWQLIRTLSELYGLEYRYNSLYINSFKELQNILMYKIDDWPLTRLYNIFIGVNPRRKVYVMSNNKLLYKSYYGGIAGTSHIQNILADIEHIGEREGNATEDMLEECLEGALYLTKLLKVNNFYINISGNGVHLYMKLEEPIELPVPKFDETPKGIKYRLKEEPINTHIRNYNKYIEKLNRYLQEYNPKLKVDEGAKDISRIARPCGSWNVKTGKLPRAVGTIYKGITEDHYGTIININNKTFCSGKQPIPNKNKPIRKLAKLTNKHRYNIHNIDQSPLYQLLISQLLPSTLSRNHYLEQSFARLLKDNNITIDQVSHLVAEMDTVQQKNVQVDPDYLDGDDLFNPEQVNNYCFVCRIPLVYEIMEDVPIIREPMSVTEYNSLNSYSSGTVREMSNGMTVKFDNLLALKMLIRQMVDMDISRSEIFFTLKNSIPDWEYFDENKIILQILNKTRKRENA